jgi:hypothetical protein
VGNLNKKLCETEIIRPTERTWVCSVNIICKKLRPQSKLLAWYFAFYRVLGFFTFVYFLICLMIINLDKILC